MSPTESDLRAALSDGEGDGVDADRLIASGRARQAQRRTHLVTTAAIVIVVAGAGTGIAALARGGGSSGDKISNQSLQNDRAAAGGASAPTAAQPSSAAGSSNGEKAADAAGGCPATLPRYALPGGGSPGQFGSDGPLFSKPVRSVIVCSYGTMLSGSAPASASATVPGRVELTGSQATRLAASLNAAAAAPRPSCARTDKSVARELAIIGIAADGSQVGTVTATSAPTGCTDQVTNGTAVRYNWTPPSDLQPILATLTPTPGPGAIPNHTPSGKVHGSPIQS